MTSARAGGVSRSSLVGRSVLLAVTVALIATVVSGALAFPLVRAAAEAQAATRLAALTDVTAAAVDRLLGGQPLPTELTRTLDDAGIEGYVVFNAQAAPDGVPQEVVARVLSGIPVTAQVDIDGVDYRIEARPLSDGSGLVLVQPQSVAQDAAWSLLTRLAIALFIGLVIAIIVGVAAARRLTRPLRAARDAAARMAAGERDLVIEPTGPSEVADIAVTLNNLSAALGVSERRQREFLLSVSHELRTPLTAIRGYGEAVRDGIAPERSGAIIVEEAGRLERLVDDLLDLARLGAVDFSYLPVETVVNEVVLEASDVWRDRCSRAGVGVRTMLPDAEVSIQTDPIRLRQIIDNLMENALRISPRDSSITVGLAVTDATVLISVSDGGPGLTDADRAIAFLPGALHARYRGERPVGTGLGLALVARLAVGLGGSADVKAAPTGGATFTVTLPRSASID